MRKDVAWLVVLHVNIVWYLEVLRIGSLKVAHRGKSVDKEGVSADDAVLGAMKQLEARRCLKVEQILMQSQVRTRIGDVGRPRHRDDVPEASVKGLAEGAQAIDERNRRIGVRRDIADKDEAVRRERPQDAQEARVRFDELGICRLIDTLKKWPFSDEYPL